MSLRMKTAKNCDNSKVKYLMIDMPEQRYGLARRILLALGGRDLAVK